MVKQEGACSPENCPKDWAGDGLTLAAVWGFPAAAMLAAALIEPALRAVVWTVMLIWMGGACVANARRCGRTHCRYTGPFFLFMAGIVAAYATGIAPLGPHGWEIIALTTLVGNGIIWWGSECLLGTFRRGER